MLWPGLLFSFTSSCLKILTTASRCNQTLVTYKQPAKIPNNLCDLDNTQIDSNRMQDLPRSYHKRFAYGLGSQGKATMRPWPPISPDSFAICRHQRALSFIGQMTASWQHSGNRRRTFLSIADFQRYPVVQETGDVRTGSTESFVGET